MTAAIVFTAILMVPVTVQLALAFGAPWGRFAWGGRHPGSLPPALRISSAVSALVLASFALLALDLAGLVDVVSGTVAQLGMWAAFGVLTLNTAMNALSHSKPERFAATPVTAILATLALVLALTGPVPREFAGMVRDDGDGPVFCTEIMESYPPQCPWNSPTVVNWNWEAVSYESQGTVRWGEYRFTGVPDGDQIQVLGVP